MLQVQQNTVLCAIKKVDPSFNTDRLHEQTGIRCLNVERKERCCTEAFKGLHNMSSDNVNKLFSVNTNIRNTRSSETLDFRARYNRTKFGDKNLPNRCE